LREKIKREWKEKDQRGDGGKYRYNELDGIGGDIVLLEWGLFTIADEDGINTSTTY
jgi:hypothetical protein